MKKILGSLLFIVSAMMIGWSAFSAIQLAVEYRRGRNSYENVEKTYVTETKPVEEKEDSSERAENNPGRKEIKTYTEKNRLKAPINVDFENLKKRNPDVAGWIYIESIDVSYPVMRGGDNEYYLNHTWDRKELFSASIFMDYRNSPDFQDYNTVIYGHNMKDGSMFHKIQYCMESSYYEKSPYIWILTPQGDFKYEIFSEYDTRYDSDTYTLFDGPGEELQKYIHKMKQQSIWEVDVDLREEEHILTLSTCNGEHDLRRIVQARRIN